jgi:hypothetical protein
MYGQSWGDRTCRPAGDGCNTICENKDGTGATITTAYCGWSKSLELGPTMQKWKGNVWHQDFEYHQDGKRLVIIDPRINIEIGGDLLAQAKNHAHSAESSALCGLQASTGAAEYYVACVDFDRLRELTGAPAYGQKTQVFVDPRNQDAVAVRVTVRRGDEVQSQLAELYQQPSGRRVAAVAFDGLDWETVTIQVLIEEK